MIKYGCKQELKLDLYLTQVEEEPEFEFKIDHIE